MRDPQSRTLRGVSLLPNLFTIGSLFSGFYSIVAAMQHLFENAAIAILVAMVFDGLDGRIARMTNSQTEFGAQLDSMSDMACFGVAPALILYIWCLSTLGKVGWLAAFLYSAATALRLARFNTAVVANKRYFTGLSCTAAAGLVASTIWLATKYALPTSTLAYLMLPFTLAMAFLQVSRIPYRSFKDLDLRESVPFVVILSIIIGLVIISLSPPDFLFLTFSIYTLSGLVARAWRWMRPRKRENNHKE